MGGGGGERAPSPSSLGTGGTRETRSDFKFAAIVATDVRLADIEDGGSLKPHKICYRGKKKKKNPFFSNFLHHGHFTMRY